MHPTLNLCISRLGLYTFIRVLDYELKYKKPLTITQDYKWLFSILRISNCLFIKTNLYSFVKHLKFLRSIVYNYKLDMEYYTYILKLRTSKIYCSKIEKFREDILFLLKKKLSISFYNLSCKKKNCNFNLKIKPFVFKLKRLNKCFQEYSNLNSRYINVKLESLQQHLHYKNFNNYKKKVFFFSSIMLNRLSLEKKIHQKNYIKKLYFRMKKNKIFLRELDPAIFSNFKLYRSKYIEQKKEYKYVLYHVLDKKYKKIRNKEKKKFKKSRKFLVLSKLYHARRRFYYNFYIPRHIEINYKTQNFLHLNYLDNLSLSSKIRLWLNLRRILSFVSF
uniref:hypothetical protein n=1 Tax=Vischeria punctata TaxID=643629 RepID=UPI0021AD1CEB|nr:hypothetical protein NUH79_mgp24 [Vischeria punctata]UUA03904.1 hypothetical protein [Vischeria punctata]